MASMTPMTRTATFRDMRDAPDLSKDTQLVEVLAFRSHSLGDGAMVADWWTT